MLSQEIFEELRTVAHEVADAASNPILAHFRTRNLAADNKADGNAFDPVTVADREAEQAMRAVLSKRRPDDGIIGEEYEVAIGTTGFDWVLDPIDGTRAFICGAPTWGVLVAVELSGKPVFGLIDQPHTGERFEGGQGVARLLHNDSQTALKARDCGRLEDAILLSTFPEVGTTSERQAFEKVRDCVKMTRYGLDCYGYALVAMGQSDLVIEAGLNRYDISAPIAVVEASGGIVTDWQGNPVKDGGQVIAAGGRSVHRQAIELLNS